MQQNEPDKHCKPCNGELPPLSPADIANEMKRLHEDWQLNENGDALQRRFEFKGFAKAVYLSNLCCWLADREGHHPDIAFGWGYCNVTLTTHEMSGLSDNDFIWAARLDALLS